MEVIKNFKVLDQLDDATAVMVIHFAIKELEQILRNEPTSGPAYKEDNSEARKAFERQRNELQRRLRLIWCKSSKPGGEPNASEVVAKPVGESTASLTGIMQVEQQPEESSSNSEILGKIIQGDSKAPLVTKPLLKPAQKIPQVETRESSTSSAKTQPTALTNSATKDESRYPPRCWKPIPLEQGHSIVHWEVMNDYLEKKVEWDTIAKSRTYCSNRNCGLFIRPENVNVRGRTATCQRCRTKTCTNCKKEQHPPYAPCHDPDLQGALNLIQENRWQRCSACGTGVERELDCNKMHFVTSVGKIGRDEPEIPPDLDDERQILANEEWIRQQRIRDNNERIAGDRLREEDMRRRAQEIRELELLRLRRMRTDWGRHRAENIDGPRRWQEAQDARRIDPWRLDQGNDMNGQRRRWPNLENTRRRGQMWPGNGNRFNN
ncbi:hypothetical protein N431DRAFT_561107 [Stipitochalara longipes BDJ]|nr:hypothetical protein N431DRAFT_561107 [Stipitochalara longipes BDJ]